jgi:1-acyl-sn-glycerol-3-phosphate acyltransferase
MPIAAETSFVLAASWLWLLGLLAAGYLLGQLRRSPYSWWENCLYLPTYLMGRVLWRVRFQNEPPAELQAGAVLTANHRSSVDPFFIQLAARRRVHWMVAKEYCRHPLFGCILRPLQVIPTNRSGMDTAATKTAVRLTRQGRLVGMFPEGRINRGQELLQPLRSGAAVVANRAQVPLIPLLIEGSPMGQMVWSPILMPARVTITFGEPIQVAPPVSAGETDCHRSAADACDRAMLKWGKQLAILAHSPDFEPQLASVRARRRHQAHANRS